MYFLSRKENVYNTGEGSRILLYQNWTYSAYGRESVNVAIGVFALVSLTSFPWVEPDLMNHGATASQPCPIDLSKLRPQMETVLASVSSPDFKEAILASLSASIPEAIQRADGINEQIGYLQSEIAEQERIQAHAEQVARDTEGNFLKPLKPCPPGEKGSYCMAVEQYYIASAANLANRAFLDALKCYQRHGLRKGS